MTLFKCTQKDKKGYVSECFYREGESAKEVLEGLQMFSWPNKGTWSVTDPPDECDDS